MLDCVLTHMRELKRKTAEIINTDAEVRVILADALSYAQTYKHA